MRYIVFFISIVVLFIYIESFAQSERPINDIGDGFKNFVFSNKVNGKNLNDNIDNLATKPINTDEPAISITSDNNKNESEIGLIYWKNGGESVHDLVLLVSPEGDLFLQDDSPSPGLIISADGFHSEPGIYFNGNDNSGYGRIVSGGRLMYLSTNDNTLTNSNDWTIKIDSFKVDFASDITVQDNATIQNNLTVQDNATIQDDLTVQDNATIQNNLTVQDNATIQDNLTVGTNPTSFINNKTDKVKVKGSILATSINYYNQNQWPDYVFEENYKLMPLEKLSTVIDKTKSLPGIPTKKEVQEEGYNSHDINVKLLEKIEELTLYTIDQHKDIKDLKNENKKLKKQIKKILKSLNN